MSGAPQLVYQFEMSTAQKGSDTYNDIHKQLMPCVDRLTADIQDGGTSFLRLPLERSDLLTQQTLVKRVQEMATDVVILGTGGSSLGAQALCGLLPRPKDKRGEFPRLHFPENLGAHSMDRLLDQLDMGLTHFIVISKSGSTAETLAQFSVCLEAARNELVESQLHQHFTVIVEPGDSPLRRMAQDFDFFILDHLSDLGGRFSVFSLVALFPAMVGGMDVIAFRKGGARVLQSFGPNGVNSAPQPIDGAINTFRLYQDTGISTHVVMPYDDRLDPFARWYQQLCAESLGKEGKGITPIRALGPVDQHSQLQLFLDGPKDKLFTIIREREVPRGRTIPKSLATDYSFDYMAGRTIGDVVTAMAKATRDTLLQNDSPVREIIIPEISEESLGELMMNFILETVLLADLMGVDAFDQPAVEQGKVLTRNYLSRAGKEKQGTN